MLIILVLLFVGVRYFNNKRAKQVAENNAALTTSVVATNAIGPASNVSAVAAQGTTGAPVTAAQAGVVITRSQCKNICKGKCGSRAGFGKRVKASRACWQTCKSQTCGWEQGDL